MDRIRLIASDMDATLLDGHSQLPPDFLHLVQELAGQDILFAAASGRPLYKLEEMFAPVLEQTLLVADNGGAVRWRGKDLFVSRMEPEVWHRLTACAEENGDSFVVCGLENAYLRPCDRCHDGLWRHLQRHRDAGGRGLRLPDGKRQPGAAQPGAVSGPAQHGIRGGPGAAAGVAAKGLRLPGGFYKSTLTP